MSEQTKTVPQDLKKTTSYTYWVDQNNKSRELPEEHRPKKISPPSTSQQMPASSGPSKWNSSGTWQERNISLKQLNQNVKNALVLYLQDKKIQLVVNSVDIEGEFKQIFSNNKRKLLYQVHGKVKFQGDGLQLKLEQFTCSGDREYVIKGKNNQQKSKLQKVAGGLVETIVGVFGRYKQ